MSVELHLPDLPEVPISLGASVPAHAADAPAPRARMPWHLRLRETLTTLLPLLAMALLALASWWLVKNSPRAAPAAETKPVSTEPDYTMNRFALERFDPTGRLALRIEGVQLRHYPDTDRVEVDEALIHAYAADGRVTEARARRAIGNGDGSEMQLWGGAEVISAEPDALPISMRSEFLHAFLVTERVRTHLPVVVEQGSTELHAAGLEYDHAQRRLELQGPMRAQLPARAAPTPAAPRAGRAK